MTMPSSHASRLARRFWWPSLFPALALLSSIWLPCAGAVKSAADYYIHNLPGAPPEPRLDMYAGHIEVTAEHHGNLFFWLVENRHIADRRRLVIWLNGGPGCSSMDGALIEIGPYRVNADGTLRAQDGSWDEFANLLFVDQPVGTGFSYADTNSFVQNMDQMAEQMLTFLTSFFSIFPEHEHDDIYIAGESYAGQWVPHLAKAILDHNSEMPRKPRWNLSGLLIGNGWFSGVEQYSAYVPFAQKKGLIPPGSRAEAVVLRQQKLCSQEIDRATEDIISSVACEKLLQEILRGTQNDKGCLNMYDVRLRDSYPSCGMNWPPDLSSVKPYLRRKDVIEALHIDSDKKTGWVECNNQVSSNFNPKDASASVKIIPALLEKIPILFFAGDQDLICNHLGIENVINKLEWNGAVGMESPGGMMAVRHEWTFEDEPAGQYQTARNLTYLKFYNSSHMVPFDYPRRSRDMLDRFMGVDIASIGGLPSDSRIDGKKGLEVSVGGHPNSTAAQEHEKTKLEAATWQAYRRSGQIALFSVIVATIVFGAVVWRGRRRRKGYAGVTAADPYDSSHRYMSTDGLGLDGSRKEDQDVEAARAYDERELDQLYSNGKARDTGRNRFPAEAEDEDEEDEQQQPALGRASRQPR